MTPFEVDDHEYNELVLKIGESVRILQDHREVGESVTELLQDLDLLHREALARIIAVLERDAPALLMKLLQDRVVQSIFLLYDFIPQPQELPQIQLSDKNFVPLTQLEVPVWIPAGKGDDFPEGELRAREVNQQNLLFCRLNGELYVALNRCVDSILPLQLGRLEGEIVICPWHGCRYHLPSGRLEGRDVFLPTFPVQVSASGAVRVGFNMGTGARSS